MGNENSQRAEAAHWLAR